MKNNKGFTLVELITVITLLGLIGLISVPVFEGITRKNKEKLYGNQIDYIILQTQKYVTENTELLTEEVTYVCINKLIEEGYFEENKIIDPRNEKKIIGKIKINYIEESQTYLYEYVNDDTNC